MNDRLSRWTPLIFACALANFSAAQLLLIGGASWPRVPLFAGPSLAMVHLATIGWLTLLMFGALFQFIPVITQQRLLHQHLSLVALVMLEGGLAMMVVGFLLLGNMASGTLLLPLGGATVIAGVLVAILNLAAPLARKSPWPLSARFVVAGLAFFMATIVIGLCFALALTGARLHPIALRLLAGGVEYHILAGIGGWFTLTAMGVSYELLPMFMLSPHDRGRWGATVFWASVAGFSFATASGLAMPFVPAGAFFAVWLVEQAARLAILGGVLLYVLDVVRLYRSRRRPQIELHNRAAIGAFVSLGLGCLWAVLLTADNRLALGAPSLVLLLLLGWLSGLGMTQLYKIVPFLAWLSWFGGKLGTRRVPRVQDLVNERNARPLFTLYFLGVIVATMAAVASDVAAVRAGVGLTLVATLLLAREYWRAWRAHYAAPDAPVIEGAPPNPFAANTKDTGHDHDRTARA